jgi:hypothetical protein
MQLTIPLLDEAARRFENKTALPDQDGGSSNA